jgi:hypothetical protein
VTAPAAGLASLASFSQFFMLAARGSFWHDEARRHDQHRAGLVVREAPHTHNTAPCNAAQRWIQQRPCDTAPYNAAPCNAAQPCNAAPMQYSAAHAIQRSNAAVGIQQRWTNTADCRVGILQQPTAHRDGVCALGPAALDTAAPMLLPVGGDGGRWKTVLGVYQPCRER